MHLYLRFSQRVDAWRTANYPRDEFPRHPRDLEFALEEGDSGQLRYLRRAQLRPETYWYLFEVGRNSKVPELQVSKSFEDLPDRLDAMGVNPLFKGKPEYNFSALIQQCVKTTSCPRQPSWKSLRESLTLDYASYILRAGHGCRQNHSDGLHQATLNLPWPWNTPKARLCKTRSSSRPAKPSLSAARTGRR